METKTTSKTVVFIHGMFMNPVSWSAWVIFFESKGYTCHTPAFPYHEGSPALLRVKSDQRLGAVTFSDVVQNFSAFIDKLPEKPILIGHSMGALVVQKLLEMDKGVSAVAIDSAPPKGIFTLKWSFLKANFPTINPLKGDQICLPSVRWFHYAFCNTMTMNDTQTAYDQFVVPESRNIPRSSTRVDGKIDFRKPHNPLLFIAGEKDHIIPASLNLKNFKAYKHKESKTDFKKFKGRTHFICGQKGWDEVAAYVEDWLTHLSS